MQQTLRTSQRGWSPAGPHSPLLAPVLIPESLSAPGPSPAPEEALHAETALQERDRQLQESDRQLQERDRQLQELCGHMERLALEKESLQHELKGLKIKVGDMNEQLGMMMETIQAKDEIIMNLSQQSAEAGGHGNCGSPPPCSKDLQEMDNLKVAKTSRE